ncbi:hypothetical protein ALO_12246 [Acetonema longum DSM 6540]|uniref:Uncharacterized protein n=1 Tax=Acetonema longum DSM 6540 TaxID=1009370 RepID=F7NK36_9FIRM|nr:hypothetical protein ALO_12246 [Acetonema longum DSM 6540]
MLFYWNLSSKKFVAIGTIIRRNILLFVEFVTENSKAI